MVGKKLLAALSALTILTSAAAEPCGIVASVLHTAPVTAYAEQVIQEETTADGWHYKEENNGVTLTGYSGTEAALTVPERIGGKTVIAIASRCFAGNTALTSLDLGTVQKLGDRIVSGCTGLKEITIPKTAGLIDYYSSDYGILEGSSIETVTFEEGIGWIPNYICKNASSVKNVILPEKEDTLDGYVIGTSAFLGTSLESVTLPESLTGIGDYAFENCALLTGITIPDNVEYLGIECFAGCKRMKSVRLGTSVRRIFRKAFRGCESLSAFDLANVSALDYKIFEGCTGLKELTIPKTVSGLVDYYDKDYGVLEGGSIETVTFEEGIGWIPNYICKNASSVKNVVLPEKEDTLDGYVIGTSAFLGTSLESVTLPESLTGIGDYAFENCALLTGITIPDNVEYLGIECFAGCKRMKSVRPGTSVRRIFRKAFRGCESLSAFDLAGVSALDYKIFEGCTGLKELTIPKTVSGLVDYYDKDYGVLQGSSIETVTFEEGIGWIPNYICKNASSVKNVVLPEKEDTLDGYVIGTSAFLGTSLESVTLPESLTGIGDYAFENCALLTGITIPDNVEYLGIECFAGCKRMKSVRLGTSVRRIFRKAFRGCESLSAFDLANVSALDYKIFEGCTSLKELTIPKTVSGLVDYYDKDYGVLQGSSIETVTFEEGIGWIPSYICKNASSVKNVVLPEKEDTLDGYIIGTSAFLGTSLESVTLPESLTGIGDYAFENCAMLKSITIPDNVEYLGIECFAGCKRMKSVRPGTSVRRIFRKAFRGCESLSAFDLAGVSALDYKIFEGCTGLKELTIPKTAGLIDYYDKDYGVLQGSSIENLFTEPGMKKIPNCLAQNCDSLRRVYLADTVSEIGTASFRNCHNLETIRSNRTNFTFSADSFSGCDMLDDYRFRILDKDSTYLLANSGIADKNGVAHFTLRYALAGAAASSAENISLTLNIPGGMTLLLDSVQSSLDIAESDIRGNSIPVNAPAGEVRFSARITENGNYNVSADLNFRYHNSNWVQRIGTAQIECPTLTLAAPETVNGQSVSVYGIAAKNQAVTVYVNGKIAAELKASAYTGAYRGDIPLPAGRPGTVYTITAECGDNTSEAVETTYEPDKPVVTKVVMRHITEELDITDVLLYGTSPVFRYDPGRPLAFDVTVTNPEEAGRLFITSTKGSQMKYIEAFYHAETGLWTAEGFFDPDVHTYVPGALNVSILPKTETFYSDKTYDFSSEPDEEIPPELMECTSAELLLDEENRKFAEIVIPDEGGEIPVQVYSDSDADGVTINGKYYTTEQIARDPEKYGFRLLPVETEMDGVVRKHYLFTASNTSIKEILGDRSTDELPDSLLDTLNDVWNGTFILSIPAEWAGVGDNPLIKMTIAAYGETSSYKIEEYLTAAFGKDFGESYGDMGTVISIFADTFHYAEELELANGDTSFTVMASALWVAKMANAYLPVDFIAPPFGLLCKVGLAVALEGLDSYLMYCMKNGEQFSLTSFLSFIRFAIDPSGTVYEAVLSNPLEGAAVTVYFMDAETGEPVKWNAEDYDQKNPLITGADGGYLWDVPEGKWKVICEKKGYQTAETEWLDVPPVQTDVHIAMVDPAAPEIISAVRDGDTVTVVFSKFVDIATVSEKTLLPDGFSGAYTVEPVLRRAGDLYTDTFTVAGKLSDSITGVTATEKILSYAGTPAVGKSFPLGGGAGFLPGDMDMDGSVMLPDVLAALEILTNMQLGIAEPTEQEFARGDVNQDGMFDLIDVICILLYYNYTTVLGMDVTYEDIIGNKV